MKKLFLSAMFAVMALGASAQQQPAKTFSVSPHLGLGYTLASKDAGYDGGVSATLGVEGVYKFNNWFGLGVGLDFFYMQSDEINKFYFSFYRLDIPVLAHFDISRHFGMFTGLNTSFNLTTRFNNDGVTGTSEGMNTCALAIPVGVKFTFNKPWTLALQYNIPVTNVSEVGTKTLKLSPIMLTVGYRFDL